ncbi:MAG: hypothetical protein KAU38_04800 [Desulfobacterales bacterium]|nr:hypothetical protein [Desulfobacterales bacterium]
MTLRDLWFTQDSERTVPFYQMGKVLEYQYFGTLSMALTKEVARNAEVSDSDTLFILGVYPGNIPELQGERGGTACTH